MAGRGKEFLARLGERVVIGDGAMGSRLYELGVPLGVNYDHLNITQPGLVRQVHREYLDAGAELIETNAFSANRVKLAPFELADRVAEINRAAVALAREVAGQRAFVAGGVGPVPPTAGDAGLDELSEADIRETYREQIVALAEAGADLLILETFTDLRQIQLALTVAKESCDLPVVAQMTFPDGRRAPDGSEASLALRSLIALGADVVGTNCGRGVAKVLRAIEYLGQCIDAPLSAFANAGMPEQVAGRSLYLMSPEYFADAAERMVHAGASLVGGCCGTRAADIAAMAERIRGLKPGRRFARALAPGEAKLATAPPRPMPDFLARLRERTVVLVEMDPPRGTDMQRLLRGARALKEAGADAVTVGDSPLGTLRMDGMVVGSILERELDIPVICHLACRDRNLIGMQSLLLGAHALGIRSILAVTGDPAKLGDHPDATSVYNLNSIKLVNLIARLNGGHNHSGQLIGQPTAFHVGVAFNPNARNLASEVERLRRKAEQGADFVMTQAVFDAATMRRACEAARAAGVTIPIFAGIYPLVSSRNAEFLHNEFPGISIADEVRRRMASASPDRVRMAAEGIAIAKELIDAFRGCADGLYIIAPLNRPRAPVELLEYIRGRNGETE
ncbi:MAG: bifunctional homocysteine S-methyltransferase/methylenetetrahydrofolate reductase [Phycisphaerae bacterium]|nr:bifunctional homocysteine S-methyltransferase/methylenetetrahydrofolate reductase [Phycisphaerae bacterium]